MLRCNAWCIPLHNTGISPWMCLPENILSMQEVLSPLTAVFDTVCAHVSKCSLSYSQANPWHRPLYSFRHFQVSMFLQVLAPKVFSFLDLTLSFYSLLMPFWLPWVLLVVLSVWVFFACSVHGNLSTFQSSWNSTLVVYQLLVCKTISKNTAFCLTLPYIQLIRKRWLFIVFKLQQWSCPDLVATLLRAPIIRVQYLPQWPLACWLEHKILIWLKSQDKSSILIYPTHTLIIWWIFFGPILEHFCPLFAQIALMGLFLPWWGIFWPDFHPQPLFFTPQSHPFRGYVRT